MMRILSLLQAQHTFAVWKFVRLGSVVWLGGRLEAAYKHSVPTATNRVGRHPARPITCAQWRLREPLIGQFIVLGFAWTTSEWIGPCRVETMAAVVVVLSNLALFSCDVAAALRDNLYYLQGLLFACSPCCTTLLVQLFISRCRSIYISE